MRLVINGRFLSQPATGVQRVAREFTRALDRLLEAGALPGISAHVVAEAHVDPAPLQLRQISFEGAGGARGHLWEQFILPRHIRGGQLLCLGNSAPLVSLLSRQPPGVMLHDQAHLLFPRDYSRSYRIWHRLIETIILRRAMPLLLVSDTERRALARRHPRYESRMVVTPNGTWPGDETSPPPLASRGSYGLFIGRPSERKNVEGALATAVRLARTRAHKFRFVGPGVEELSARIPTELRSLISFHGYVDDSELPDLYRKAAYLLYPSFYEASGLPPSEAMHFGCPVIASDLPVLRERCGDAALYCDPHDRDSIYVTVAKLLDEPDTAEALAERGRCRTAAFTWRLQAKRIAETLYTVSRARQKTSSLSDAEPIFHAELQK